MGKIKSAHIAYLLRIGSSPHAEALRPRLHNLAVKFRGFLRKADGSENGLRVIPVLAGLMFGLSEDVRRFRLPAISFDVEAKEMNRSLIAGLDARIKSKYFGQCASYGEAILNCYLDLFITFTVRGTPKNLGVKPGFLVNPATGALLELDVLFEDFRLAFEFQGEHHYSNPKDQRKDQIKLATCAAHRRILVPVNIGQ